MDNELDQKIESTERDITYFEKMINGAEKLIKPWKTALIVCIIGWTITLTAFIAFAYLAPTEMQQNQDNPNQQQEQIVKGAVNGETISKN